MCAYRCWQGDDEGNRFLDVAAVKVVGHVDSYAALADIHNIKHFDKALSVNVCPNRCPRCWLHAGVLPSISVDH